MSKFKELCEKLATGDMIETQIFIFFGVMVAAIAFVFFVGRTFLQKKPEKPIRMDKKPQKSWKNFCRAK